MFKNPPQLSVSKSCVLAAVAGGSGSRALESLHEGCWWGDLVITSLSREQGKLDSLCPREGTGRSCSQSLQQTGSLYPPIAGFIQNIFEEKLSPPDA